ncbi:hypothetical protein PENTCL1PPCAC_19838, partial [Pristionchus entomophagus]
FQMSLSKLSPPLGKKRRIDSKKGDYVSYKFPFLALPNELKSHVFSFLPIKDRLRARVNKMLYAIESDSKYFVKKLLIREMSIADCDFNPADIFKHQIIWLFEEKSYSSDLFKKISQNAFIGSLDIRLSGSSQFHKEVCSMIKDFNLEE